MSFGVCVSGTYIPDASFMERSPMNPGTGAGSDRLTINCLSQVGDFRSMMRIRLFHFALFFLTLASSARAADSLVEQLTLGVKNPITILTTNPPKGFVADSDLGILRHRALRGQVVHTARDGVRGLFEARAVRTPAGDLLLMFPEGTHYANGSGKVNDMIAYRSSDNGNTEVRETATLYAR